MPKILDNYSKEIQNSLIEIMITAHHIYKTSVEYVGFVFNAGEESHDIVSHEQFIDYKAKMELEHLNSAISLLTILGKLKFNLFNKYTKKTPENIEKTKKIIIELLEPICNDYEYESRFSDYFVSRFYNVCDHYGLFEN